MVAAIDQDVGHRFGQLQALRDGEQMFLALGPRIFGEIGVAERLRIFQDRLGDDDGVVERERADDSGRAAVDMGEALRQTGARLHFDIGDQLLQHVVEQRDLVAAIAARTGGEQIGDALEDALALHIAAGRNRFIELVDQRAAERRIQPQPVWHLMR